MILKQLSGFKRRNISFNDFLMIRTLLRIIVIISAAMSKPELQCTSKIFYHDQSDQDGLGEVDDDVMVILS